MKSVKFLFLFLFLSVVLSGLVLAECSDTDNGTEYYKKGVVSFGGNSFADYCIGDSLMEYYCNNDFSKVENKSYDCSYSCKNGACLEESLSESCIDSDGGKEYFVKGVVTYDGMEWPDQCSENNRSLVEYYCDEAGADGVSYKCPGICRDSACYDASESDSCYDHGHLCVPSSRGCGQYDKYDFDCDDSGLVCCSAIPVCGDNFCNCNETPNGRSENFENCPSDCSVGDCDYYVVNNTNENTIDNSTYIDREILSDDHYDSGESSCNGCLVGGECYSVGYRALGEYCSGDWQQLAQKESGESCDNNFECSSNVCVDSECVSGGLLKKILNWFRHLFG